MPKINVLSKKETYSSKNLVPRGKLSYCVQLAKILTSEGHDFDQELAFRSVELLF